MFNSSYFLLSSCPNLLHSNPDSGGHKTGKNSFPVWIDFLCLFTSMWFHFQHRQNPTCKTTLRKWKQKTTNQNLTDIFKRKNFKSFTTENYSLPLFGTHGKGCVIFSKAVDISLEKILWMGRENQNLFSSRTNAYDFRPREVKKSLFNPKAEMRVYMLSFQEHGPVVLSTVIFFLCLSSQWILSFSKCPPGCRK